MKVTLGNTKGAGFLGCVLGSILFGISLVQVYLYYVQYPKDWLFQKVVVALLLALETTHTALVIYSVYFYVVERVENLSVRHSVVWSIKVLVLFDVIILLAVQSLYTMRIWKLGSHFSRIWPAIIIVGQAGAYVVGIFLVYHSFTLGAWAGLPHMTAVIKATFSYSTGFDIVLAGSMCYYLNKARNQTCFRPTSNRIVSIMRYILISGAITSATSLAILLCYVIMPNNLIFLGVSFIVTKVYVNSYLAMLNARSSTRGRPSPYKAEDQITYLRSDGGLRQRKTASANHKGDEIHSDSFQLSSVSTHDGVDTTLGGTQSEPPSISIQIHHAEERRIDEGTQYSSQV